RLLGVVDDVAGQRRLVVEDEVDDVLPGDVLRRDDDDLVPGHARPEAHGAHAAARHLRAHRDAVPHALELDVVDVARLAGQLGARFFSGYRTANYAGHPSAPRAPGSWPAPRGHAEGDPHEHDDGAGRPWRSSRVNLGTAAPTAGMS